MGTQENIKGALEKSWDFIRDSSIRISFETFKTYRITRLKFEKNGIKKTLDAKFREIGEIAHGAMKKGEEIEGKVKDLCKAVDDLYCSIEIVDQEIEKIEKEEPPIESEKREKAVSVPFEEGQAKEPPDIPKEHDIPERKAEKAGEPRETQERGE